jgi:hypothetical protein
MRVVTIYWLSGDFLAKTSVSLSNWYTVLQILSGQNGFAPDIPDRKLAQFSVMQNRFISALSNLGLLEAGLKG